MKKTIFWVILTCVVVLVWQVVKSNKTQPDNRISFSEFVNDVKAGKVKRVSISGGSEVIATHKDSSSHLHTLIPDRYTEIYTILQDHGVEIEIKERNGGWLALLFSA